MAADSLETGEWAITANGLTIKVASGEQLIAMTFGPEQRQLMQQAVEASAGRSLRFSVVSGGTKNAAPPAVSRPATPGGARAKAVQHPVVRRMMEKFGAELRTVRDSDQ